MSSGQNNDSCVQQDTDQNNFIQKLNDESILNEDKLNYAIPSYAINEASGSTEPEQFQQMQNQDTDLQSMLSVLKSRQAMKNHKHAQSRIQQNALKHQSASIETSRQKRIQNQRVLDLIKQQNFADKSKFAQSNQTQVLQQSGIQSPISNLALSQSQPNSQLQQNAAKNEELNQKNGGKVVKQIPENNQKPISLKQNSIDPNSDIQQTNDMQRISSSIDYDERDFVTSTQENIYSEKKLHVGNEDNEPGQFHLNLHGGTDHQRQTSINRVKRMTPQKRLISNQNSLLRTSQSALKMSASSPKRDRVGAGGNFQSEMGQRRATQGDAQSMSTYQQHNQQVGSLYTNKRSESVSSRNAANELQKPYNRRAKVLRERREKFQKQKREESIKRLERQSQMSGSQWGGANGGGTLTVASQGTSQQFNQGAAATSSAAYVGKDNRNRSRQEASEHFNYTNFSSAQKMFNTSMNQSENQNQNHNQNLGHVQSNSAPQDQSKKANKQAIANKWHQNKDSFQDFIVYDPQCNSNNMGSGRLLNAYGADISHIKIVGSSQRQNREQAKLQQNITRKQNYGHFESDQQTDYSQQGTTADRKETQSPTTQSLNILRQIKSQRDQLLSTHEQPRQPPQINSFGRLLTAGDTREQRSAKQMPNFYPSQSKPGHHQQIMLAQNESSVGLEEAKKMLNQKFQKMMDWGLSSQLTSGKLTRPTMPESRNAMNKIVQENVPTFGVGSAQKARTDIISRSKVPSVYGIQTPQDRRPYEGRKSPKSPQEKEPQYASTYDNFSEMIETAGQNHIKQMNYTNRDQIGLKEESYLTGRDVSQENLSSRNYEYSHRNFKGGTPAKVPSLKDLLSGNKKINRNASSMHRPSGALSITNREQMTYHARPANPNQFLLDNTYEFKDSSTNQQQCLTMTNLGEAEGQSENENENYTSVKQADYEQFPCSAFFRDKKNFDNGIATNNDTVKQVQARNYEDKHMKKHMSQAFSSLNNSGYFLSPSGTVAPMIKSPKNCEFSLAGVVTEADHRMNMKQNSTQNNPTFKELESDQIIAKSRLGPDGTFSDERIPEQPIFKIEGRKNSQIVNSKMKDKNIYYNAQIQRRQSAVQQKQPIIFQEKFLQKPITKHLIESENQTRAVSPLFRKQKSMNSPDKQFLIDSPKSTTNKQINYSSKLETRKNQTSFKRESRKNIEILNSNIRHDYYQNSKNQKSSQLKVENQSLSHPTSPQFQLVKQQRIRLDVSQGRCSITSISQQAIEADVPNAPPENNFASPLKLTQKQKSLRQKMDSDNFKDSKTIEAYYTTINEKIKQSAQKGKKEEITQKPQKQQEVDQQLKSRNDIQTSSIEQDQQQEGVKLKSVKNAQNQAFMDNLQNQNDPNNSEFIQTQEQDYSYRLQTHDSDALPQKDEQSQKKQENILGPKYFIRDGYEIFVEKVYFVNGKAKKSIKKKKLSKKALEAHKRQQIIDRKPNLKVGNHQSAQLLNFEKELKIIQQNAKETQLTQVDKKVQPLKIKDNQSQKIIGKNVQEKRIREQIVQESQISQNKAEKISGKHLQNLKKIAGHRTSRMGSINESQINMKSIALTSQSSQIHLKDADQGFQNDQRVLEENGAKSSRQSTTTTHENKMSKVQVLPKRSVRRVTSASTQNELMSSHALTTRTNMKSNNEQKQKLNLELKPPLKHKYHQKSHNNFQEQNNVKSGTIQTNKSQLLLQKSGSATQRHVLQQSQIGQVKSLRNLNQTAFEECKESGRLNTNLKGEASQRSLNFRDPDLQLVTSSRLMTLADVSFKYFDCCHQFILHKMIFAQKFAELLKVFKSKKLTSEQINERDHRGNTPLLLAGKLSAGNQEYLKCINFLFKEGCDGKIRDKNGWSLMDEAIAQGNSRLLAIAFSWLNIRKKEKVERNKRRVCARLKKIPDFYLEINWECHSNWIPFVSKIAPSDNFQIWKIGSNIRLDFSLVGFQNFQNKRRRMSILFRDPESAALQDERYKDIDLIMVNKDREILTNPLEDLDPEEKLAVLTDIMNADPVQNKLNITKQEWSQVSGIFGGPVNEVVNEYNCVRHKVTVEAQVQSKRKVNQKFDHTFETYFEGSEEFDPQKSIQVDQGTFKVAKDVTKSIESQLWLSSEYPLQFRQFMEVLDTLAISGHASLQKIHEFLQNESLQDVASQNGFPVKIQVPVGMLIKAEVTFGNFEFLSPEDPQKFVQETFAIPDYCKLVSRMEAMKTLTSKKKRLAVANFAT